MYVLDTDTCIFALRHHPHVTARLGTRFPVDVAVSAMTEAGLYFGAHEARDPVTSRRDVDANLGPITRLPFDSDAAEQPAALRCALRSQPIGERDLVIASTVLAHGYALVTRDQREFGRVPGLILEDWTVP